MLSLELILTAVALLFITSLFAVREGFGSTSPGTMVQLATSHVPTEDDIYFYQNTYPKIVRREITNMTGGDPGPLFV
jgi:hypothetical protein